MRRTLANEICAALPGAVLEHSFGPDTDTWKVGGKIFALIQPGGAGLSVKCPDDATAAFLIDIGVARPAPYLKRGGWVQLTWGTFERGEMTEDDLRFRLEASHIAVIRGLPKRLRPVAE